MKDRIKIFVESHPELVNVKTWDSFPGLRMLKYKNKVFYKNLWTPEICECRGTVIDDDWNIVSRPFTKIFNYNEPNASKFSDDEVVTVSRKINGFMGAITVRNGKLLFSTTGSLDSPFTERLRESFYRYCTDIDYFKKFCNGGTLSVEVVRKDDPHIISESPGIYLLSYRRNVWETRNHTVFESDLDYVAAMCGFKRPEWDITTFGQIKEELKECSHEGFVVWNRHKETKMKSPYYLITKFLGRVNINKVDNMFNHTEKFKQTLDEEFYGLVNFIVNAYSEKQWLDKTEQERINIIRNYLNEQ